MINQLNVINEIKRYFDIPNDESLIFKLKFDPEDSSLLSRIQLDHYARLGWINEVNYNTGEVFFTLFSSTRSFDCLSNFIHDIFNKVEVTLYLQVPVNKTNIHFRLHCFLPTETFYSDQIASLLVDIINNELVDAILESILVALNMDVDLFKMLRQ